MSLAAGLSMLASVPAPSQPAPVLEEIIVTAQRREERLQEVPISASALSTLELERRQIDDLVLLQYAVPNLSIAPSQVTGTSASIAMRGQYESDTTPTVDPAVGLYLDGVYFARMTGANLDLIDLERVEVLRGPQGTLFGRNTVGGAINLIPRHPEAEFSASLKTGFGNYRRQEFIGMVNAPLFGRRIDTRLTAEHSEHGGYAHDPLLNTELANDDTDFARLQLQFAPAVHTLANLAADYSKIESGSQTRTLYAAAPGSESIPAIFGSAGDSLMNYVDPYGNTVPANRAGTVATTVWGVASTLTIERVPLTVKSITAYRALEFRATDSDQDGTPYDLGVVFSRSDRQHQFSQELQLLGRARNGRLEWIAGLLYFGEDASFAQRFQVFVPATRSFSENIPWGDASNESLAAYTQLSLALTQYFKLTAGARYNEDSRQLTSHNARSVAGVETCRLSATLLDQAGVCVATRPARRFRYAPFTASLQFSPNPATMLYGKVSRGFRAGGYNIRGTNEIDMDTFDPERIDSFEIGSKAELFGDRLRIHLAMFHTQFEDIQLLQHETLPGQVLSPRFIRNGGKAHIDGGELEAVALLKALRLTAAFGVTHAHFTKLDAAVIGVTLDSTFMFTPGTTASIAADLPIRTGFGTLTLHNDYSWRDDIAFTYDRASPARQDAYGLLNAVLTANFDRSGLQLSLWGRNLTNQHYVMRAWENDYYVSAAPGNPRTFGITLACQFGSRQRAD